MSTPHDKKRFIGRTSLITAAAIAGVVFAGAVAVGANIGILNAADDSEIGSLSAAGDLVPAGPQVVDVYVDDPTAATSATASTSLDSAVDDSAVAQEFAVDVAGTVGVVPTAGGVRLGDVVANPGWTWSLAQSDPSALTVTFTARTSTDDVRTLNFTASIAPDGAITAAVEEPIVSVSPTAPPAQFQDDDDDHGDDDHEDEEHEGGDDDD